MTTANPGATDGPVSGQILAFRLGDETFCVDLLRVKEIRGWSAVTRLPQTPDHLLGVLNLRGTVVPIIDLRKRFALASAEFSPLTVIIVLSLNTASGTRECGVVVDSVSDVFDVKPGSVKPAPECGDPARACCIEGLITIDDRMLILLDTDELVACDLRIPALAAAA
jgi:purine-binding chemotaxis protein CheW